VTAGMIATTEQRMVLGLGASGRSVARWWRAQNLPFVAADTRVELSDSGDIRVDLGPDTPALFGDIDPAQMDRVSLLVVSPGIALDHPLVDRARAAGARILGDIDLFCEAVQAPVIGITGSNGKSTVTAMLGVMIEACNRRVAVGGNLGTPALDLLDENVEYYVLELSSFQLERAGTLGLDVATVLNVSPDHLDRHGTLPLYHQAKHRIFGGVKAVVANRTDPLTIPLLEQAADLVFWRLGEPDLDEFGVRTVDGQRVLCHGFDPLLPVDELRVVGEHNVANALAALALGFAAGLPAEGLVEGLRAFSGLPHRCETVMEQAGIPWINDSKATNIGATVAALRGLGGARNVVLIAGGQGKGQDFSELRAAAGEFCSRVVTLGEAARSIEVALGATVPCLRVPDLDAAVERAASLVEPGGIVLLSPACASFDMFDGFEARGDAFRHAVNRHFGCAA